MNDTEHTPPNAQLTVIYDGDCGICNRLRQWAEARTQGSLHFAPNQTADLVTLAPGLTRAQARQSAYAIRPDGRRYHGARAIFETLRHVGGVWSVIGRIGALPPVSLLAEPFYRVIAHHRARISAWLGLAHCGIPAPPDSEPRG